MPSLMRCTAPNNALEPPPTAAARTSLRLLAAAHRGRSCAKRSLALLAGCKSLRRKVSPPTPPACCACEGGAKRTTRGKRPQGTPETAGEPARPEACDRPVSAADADGDGVHAPEASPEAAVG